MMAEISRRKSLKYIRVHITGDFYSKEYIDKWAKIAEMFPFIIFRTNTRRVGFLKYMKKVLPANFIVRESTDTTRKWSGVFPQAAIIGTPGSEKFFTCHDDCEACKFHCWNHRDINVVTSQIRGQK